MPAEEPQSAFQGRPARPDIFPQMGCSLHWSWAKSQEKKQQRLLWHKGNSSHHFKKRRKL
jgi:hypothetical protein